MRIKQFSSSKNPEQHEHNTNTNSNLADTGDKKDDPKETNDKKPSHNDDYNYNYQEIPPPKENWVLGTISEVFWGCLFIAALSYWNIHKERKDSKRNRKKFDKFFYFNHIPNYNYDSIDTTNKHINKSKNSKNEDSASDELSFDVGDSINMGAMIGGINSEYSLGDILQSFFNFDDGMIGNMNDVDSESFDDNPSKSRMIVEFLWQNMENGNLNGYYGIDNESNVKYKILYLNTIDTLKGFMNEEYNLLYSSESSAINDLFRNLKRYMELETEIGNNDKIILVIDNVDGIDTIDDRKYFAKKLDKFASKYNIKYQMLGSNLSEKGDDFI